MEFPSGLLRDVLLTVTTTPLLPFIQTRKLPLSDKLRLHFPSEPLFEILFEFGIVWIGFPFDLDVTSDGSFIESFQSIHRRFAVIVDGFTGKGPIQSFNPVEVSILDPSSVLVVVSPSCPSP